MRDPVARMKWDIQWAIMQARNLRRAEAENDKELAKHPINSHPWRAKMKKANYIRNELIRLNAVLLPADLCR